MANRMITQTCVLMCLAAFFAAPMPAAAKIVSEGKLAQYCADEAARSLGVSPTDIMMLPVEQSKGKFIAYGQTDDSSPATFQCTFSSKRAFEGIDIQGAAVQETAPAGGNAPKAALNKCLDMFGLPANVEMVSDFGNGFYEIIMKGKTNARKVACTVPADGSQVDDWVEMN